MGPRRPDQPHQRQDAQRNRERVARAAARALHREGPAVPMATIASDAGVGVGTLYRHFPTRDDLVEELTHRSFELMLAHVQRAAASDDGPATEALRVFLAAVIADRDEMVLPSTGGPAVRSERTRRVQDRIHAAIEALLDRGRAEGTIARRVDVWDVAWLGATLAQPGRAGPEWDRICLRLLDTYLAGLGVPPPQSSRL